MPRHKQQERESDRERSERTERIGKRGREKRTASVKGWGRMENKAKWGDAQTERIGQSE